MPTWVVVEFKLVVVPDAVRAPFNVVAPVIVAVPAIVKLPLKSTSYANIDAPFALRKWLW